MHDGGNGSVNGHVPVLHARAELADGAPEESYAAAGAGAEPILSVEGVGKCYRLYRRRADRVKQQEAAFFAERGPEAREILSLLLEKYAADGEVQFTLPDVLKVPPISQHGNVNEIIGKFGGPEELRSAVNELQSLLYAA